MLSLPEKTFNELSEYCERNQKVKAWVLRELIDQKLKDEKEKEETKQNV